MNSASYWIIKERPAAPKGLSNIKAFLGLFSKGLIILCGFLPESNKKRKS